MFVCERNQLKIRANIGLRSYAENAITTVAQPIYPRSC
jgi:hypothetical protein